MWQQSDKFRGMYRIPSARLQGYDYGANGCYYVTICTKNKEYYFGEIVQTDNDVCNDVQRDVETRLIASLPTDTPAFPHLQPTAVGQIAEKMWLEIPQHFPFVVLDEFVIMPNHIHGILFFCKNDEIMDNADMDTDTGMDTGRDAINRVSTNRADTPEKQIGGITGIHNPMLHQNLGRVLRWFKGRVSFECRNIDAAFAWQERFYDSIIRDNNSLVNVREYIFNNPANWNNDELNDKNIGSAVA